MAADCATCVRPPASEVQEQPHPENDRWIQVRRGASGHLQVERELGRRGDGEAVEGFERLRIVVESGAIGQSRRLQAGIGVADAVQVVVATGNDALPAESRADAPLDGVGVLIGDAGTCKQAEALDAGNAVVQPDRRFDVILGVRVLPAAPVKRTRPG